MVVLLSDRICHLIGEHMKINIYTSFDRVANLYGELNLAHNHGEAKRNFTTGIMDNPHKDDYTLYYIGSYDPETGIVQAPEKPIWVDHAYQEPTENVAEPLSENRSR